MNPPSRPGARLVRQSYCRARYDRRVLLATSSLSSCSNPTGFEDSARAKPRHPEKESAVLPQRAIRRFGLSAVTPPFSFGMFIGGRAALATGELRRSSRLRWNSSLLPRVRTAADRCNGR